MPPKFATAVSGVGKRLSDAFRLLETVLSYPKSHSRPTCHSSIMTEQKPFPTGEVSKTFACPPRFLQKLLGDVLPAT